MRDAIRRHIVQYVEGTLTAQALDGWATVAITSCAPGSTEEEAVALVMLQLHELSDELRSEEDVRTALTDLAERLGT